MMGRENNDGLIWPRMLKASWLGRGRIRFDPIGLDPVALTRVGCPDAKIPCPEPGGRIGRFRGPTWARPKRFM